MTDLQYNWICNRLSEIIGRLPAKEKAKLPLDVAACSAFATILRHKYPHEYSGWNVEYDSPKWTSDRLDAAPVPLEILVSELNKIAARETGIWAVVYPQNAQCAGTDASEKTL